MKIAMKLFALAFLASAAISVNADEPDQSKAEKTPATSKIQIANKNGATAKSRSAQGSSEGVVVSEASAINPGRQLESEGTAAPMNEKNYSNARPLSK